MDSFSLEQAVKGFANHRRIDVLYQLKSQPDMSVEELAAACQVDYKTLAVHLRRMTTSGLISKKYYGRRVEHRLTDRGHQVLSFLRQLT